jgi:hypothetical protein
MEVAAFFVELPLFRVRGRGLVHMYLPSFPPGLGCGSLLFVFLGIVHHLAVAIRCFQFPFRGTLDGLY